MRMNRLAASSWIAVLTFCMMPSTEAAFADDAPPAVWTFSCKADNDLFKALTSGGSECLRCDSPAEAVRAAPEGSAVLILADGYPEKPTAIEPAVFDEAAKKKLQLFVEYPAALPDVQVGPPKNASRLERGVIVSNIFGERLPPMRLATINACRYVPVNVENPHIVLAKAAGVNTAVFGLKDTPTVPVLFDHPRGDLLVATTKLSHFVTGRYMPDEAWRTIWQTILGRLQPEGAKAEAIKIAWTPTVRPSFGRDEPLPPDAEARAVRRSADWFAKSRVFRAPSWPKAVLDRSQRFNTLLDMPGDDCPGGDGSLGVLEGFSSTIRLDGSQPIRYAVRNDCMGETAMLMALDAAVSKRPRHALVAANLLDYTFTKSGLAGGPRADPKNSAYGLVGWALDASDQYWGDDNARAILGALAVSGIQKDSRWADAIARNILANFRTTGPNGHRPHNLSQAGLDSQGWKHYWQHNKAENTPHMTAWLWPCFLWAYEKTRYEPFLTRSEAGYKTLMDAYPKWDYVNGSGSLEMARALLPLAWLVRVKDTPEHRRWLCQIAEDLIALQDSSGGIREITRVGQGTYRNCLATSNAQYGTCETSLIQTEGDPISDMLYTCNFALIGLHEAAAATGEPFYAEAEEKLAKFLCRIQIRSEKHPELDGAWYRAFNFRNWDYWASNADSDWGPWCTETGWTQPWIAGTLALRQMNTSLWDVAKQSEISPNFDRLRREMLPD